MVITSAVLASPEARSHPHGAEAGAGGSAAMAGDGHGHGGEGAAADEVANDRGLSLLTNGHHHEIVQQPMSPSTQLELKGQLAITREVAEQYPTVADAEAAGYTRAGCTRRASAPTRRSPTAPRSTSTAC